MASRSLSAPPSSCHKTMASRALSDLPPEVVINIFSCLHDHHAITALNLTSRKFYEIWKLNTATITKAVLPRAITCFDLAQELLALQGRSPDGGQAESREAVLEGSKRLLVNAAVLHVFSHVRVLDAEDRVASLQCQYRVWIALELFNDREARDSRLQAATLEQIRGMAKALDYNFGGFYEGGARWPRCCWCEWNDADGIFETYAAIMETLELKESLSEG